MNDVAKVMLDAMIKEEIDEAIYRVLSYIHNFHSENWILEVNVLRPGCWAMCVGTKERKPVRKIMLKGYGSPATWTSQDLTQLNDLLMVLARSDLATALTDVKSNTKPFLLYEACKAWLGGMKGRQQ